MSPHFFISEQKDFQALKRFFFEHEMLDQAQKHSKFICSLFYINFSNGLINF
jgi:hypothetical protein